MPSLSAHSSSSLVKLLLIGDAKSGKTGAIPCLVADGYKIRILDFDNLLDIFRQLVIKNCPDKIDNVEYRTLRDDRKASALGSVIEGKPKAWVEGMKMLDNWKYTTDAGEEIDYGKPYEWGDDTILVIDSLSRLCDAAFDFHMGLVPQGKNFDPRAVYKNAQDDVENVLGMLTGPSFATNVIVICHILYQDQPDGTKKGFPQGVGQALSPKIPQYFPSYALVTNKGGKRTIQTTSTPLIDLANPAPFLMAPSYPQETGLSEFFKVLRAPPKPKAITLKRA